MLQFEGRHIRVDIAAGVSKSIRGGGKNVLYDSGKSVFLGNLPFDVVVSPCPLHIAHPRHRMAPLNGNHSLCGPPIWLAGRSRMPMTALTLCWHIYSMGEIFQRLHLLSWLAIPGNYRQARIADAGPGFLSLGAHTHERGMHQR